MTLFDLAKIIGTVATLIIFLIKGWLAIMPEDYTGMKKNQIRSSRRIKTTLLWFAIWVFFYFIVRIFSLFNIASSYTLTIITGFSLLIPLGGIILNLFINRKIEELVE